MKRHVTMHSPLKTIEYMRILLFSLMAEYFLLAELGILTPEPAICVKIVNKWITMRGAMSKHTLMVVGDRESKLSF